MWSNTAMTGQEDGPIMTENWKRAIHRPPPSRFTVETLPPIKLGSNFNFKMRICPIARGDRVSVSSKGSNTEYEILRRWEDCLIFQDTLEREYSRLATSKRERLIAGKGVRKNDVYLVDRASSWESLPPGPEPDSVAQSIHDLVPKLTKRGTMFRASQATTDQRHGELTAFIAALWKEDVPTLLEDFRQSRTVTDFFGFWRRDQDIQKTKAALKASSRVSVSSSFFSGEPRNSIGSSIYSADFEDSDENYTRARALSSASSDSSSSPSTGSARSSISVQITLDDTYVAFGYNPHHGVDGLGSLQEVSEVTRRPSNRGGFLAAVTKRVRKAPTQDSEARRGRPSLDADPARPDSKASDAPTTRRTNRESWQTTASGMSFLNDLNLTMPDQPSEDSRRMSMASIATFRTEVSSEGVIPRYYVPEPNPARLSTASFMTDISADAIIPRSPRRPDSRATLSQDSRGHQRTSSIASDGESVLDEYFYDAFPRPCSFIPESHQQSRSETPISYAEAPESPKTSPVQPTVIKPAKIALPTSPSPTSPPSSPANSEFAIPKSPSSPTPGSPRTPISSNFFYRKEALARVRSPSPNGSMVSASVSVLSDSTMQSSFSDSTGTTITPSLYSFYSARSTVSSITTDSSATSASPSALVIKAAHNNAIILLRAEADLPLDEIRRRLREKFLGQEGITLSEGFALAYMIPATPAKASVPSRARANSTGNLTDAALMEMISTEEEWARLRSSLEGAKLTLRVMDSASITR